MENIIYHVEFIENFIYEVEYHPNGKRKLCRESFSDGTELYSFKYDENGNKVYYQNSGGERTKWEYDQNERLIYEETNKNNKHRHWYQYDDLGRDICVRDNKGYWSVCHWDKNGNRYQITKYGDFSYVNDSGVEIKKNIGHLESFKSFVDVMKKTLDFGKFDNRQYYDEEMYIYYNLKVRKETKLWYKEFI